MALDPSIILAGAQPAPQPFGMNSIAQLMQMKQMQTQMRRDQAVQNSLAAIYANPANLGPDGMPNAQAMMQIAKVSPDAAQKMMLTRATLDEKRALTSQHQATAGMEAQNTIQSMVRDPALNAYDQALAGGKSPQEATAIAQRVYSEGLESLSNGGYIPDAMKAQVPMNFDPVRVRANSLSYKDQQALYEKRAADERADRRADQADARMDQQARHERVMEGLAEAREARIERELTSSNAPPSKDGTVNGFSPEDIDILARKDMAGLPLNLSRGKSMDPVRRAITERQLQIAKEEGGDAASAVEKMQQGKADTAGIAKTVRDFSTGPQGNAVRSLDVSISHLGTLQELSDALKNHDIQSVNRLSNAYSKATGAPAVTNFNAAKQIVGDEIVKGIVGAGGSSADREKAQESIDAANSPEQLLGVIRTYKELLGGQLSGLQQQYEGGSKRKDFGKFLTPETKKALNFKESEDSKPKIVHWDDL